MYPYNFSCFWSDRERRSSLPWLRHCAHLTREPSQMSVRNRYRKSALFPIYDFLSKVKEFFPNEQLLIFPIPPKGSIFKEILISSHFHNLKNLFFLKIFFFLKLNIKCISEKLNLSNDLQTLGSMVGRNVYQPCL